MTRRLAVATAVAALAAATPAPAQDAAVAVACEVKGHDLILYNRGEADLAAGTVIHWDAWNGKRTGDHALEAPLKPFIGLELTGALEGSYFWDRPCEASVVENASGTATTTYVGPPQDLDRRNGHITMQGGKGNQ